MDFYLRRLQDDIRSAIAGATDAELAWHPVGKWCISEILEHLYLTYTGTIKGLERCLAVGAPSARPPNAQDRLRTFVVVRCGYMPRGRKSPKQGIPRGLPGDEVRANILTRIDELEAKLAQGVGAFGKDALLLEHPILGPLRGEEWSKFHWVHGHHHTKQIRALRKSFASLGA